MTLPDQQPPKKKRGGVPAGQFCLGCGGISTGIHLDRELLPLPPKEGSTN